MVEKAVSQLEPRPSVLVIETEMAIRQDTSIIKKNVTLIC
jgi:hypothetical protein